MNRLDRGVNRIGARKRRRANPLATAVSALATLAVVLGLLYAMAGPDQPASADLSAQVVAALPTDTPRSTPTPSPTPTPVPTPVPTPEMLRAPELEALPTPSPRRGWPWKPATTRSPACRSGATSPAST